LIVERFVEEAGEEGVLVDEVKMYIGVSASRDTDPLYLLSMILNDCKFEVSQ
jgi:hypothetical protein